MGHINFFDFDQIDYYVHDIDESDTITLSDNRLRSVIDKMKFDVILGDVPRDISDLECIAKLERIGYKKSLVSELKHAGINEVFSEKKATDPVYTACIYIYRDILVFKKLEKVIGVAKICFSCNGYHITGTEANTGNFGQDGDYGVLYELLRH